MTRHRELTGWIASVCAQWLGNAAVTATLQDALRNVIPAAPPPTALAGAQGPILFPLLYHNRPRVTSALFHQVVDACQEGRRTRRRVCLVGAAVGRGKPAADAPNDLAAICKVLDDEGWPVEFGGDVVDLDGCAYHLAARARSTSYTRRATDLPDLFVAAAYDAVGASAVYLTEGVKGGRSIGRLPAIAPLGRLHAPGDPFASTPMDAKLRPAGYDQIWGAAFTLGETTAVALTDNDRLDVACRVHRRLEPGWRALRRAGLTAHHGLTTPDTRRVVASGMRHALVIVPLFGARMVSSATGSLVKVASALADATLVVDDVTPMLLYRLVDLDAIRAGFAKLAADAGGRVSFLGDLDEVFLQERVVEALQTLTLADLIAASPYGKAGRSQAVFTGYDAIHLAIMGVACGLRSGAALATQAANVPAVRALTSLHGIDSLIVRSGPTGSVQEHEFRIDAAWLALSPAGRSRA